MEDQQNGYIYETASPAPGGSRRDPEPGPAARRTLSRSAARTEETTP